MNSYTFRRCMFLSSIFLSSFFAPGIVTGQNQCGTDEMYRIRVQQHPEILLQQKQMEETIASIRNAQAKTNLGDNGQVIIVPVVFHIIHQNGPENIKNQLIYDQIARLNIDYRKLNKDTSNVRDIFKPLISDAKIEFRLATVNPWGQCTNGIDRVVSALTIDAGEPVKSLSWWDSRQYLNIWVVRNINSTGVNGEIEGYSHFPWDATTSPSADGIIMGYEWIGKGQRVLSHEVGHYFGLYHTFQDSCSKDQQLEGDHCEDTPPVAAPNFHWPMGVNSCHGETPDMPDMIENYMDYADNHYLFTTDQVWRMRAFALSRKNLVSQENLNIVLGNACMSGIKEEQIFTAENISVYPNPSFNEVNLAISLPSRQTGAITIMDVTGKTLFSKPNISLEEGGQNLSFSRESLNIQKPGVYIMQIAIGSSIVEKKLVFQE